MTTRCPIVGVLLIVMSITVSPIPISASTSQRTLEQLPPAPGFTPIAPPVPEVSPPCEAPPPQHYTDGKHHWKVLFVSGFAGPLQMVDPRPIKQLGWYFIKSKLRVHPWAAPLKLTDDDFLYYSYSGRYACSKMANSSSPETRYKDFRAPDYIGWETRLGSKVKGFTGGVELYDQRAAQMDEILASYPEDTFLIVAHSLGGVVSLYWAATRPQLADRVHAIVTLDSPLAASPSACVFPWSPFIPGQVIAALPEAVHNVRVSTVQESADTVVPPRIATLPGVWRSWLVELDHMRPVHDPCDLDAHHVALYDLSVSQDIILTTRPGEIIQPTSLKPTVISLSNISMPFDIMVALPSDPTSAAMLARGDHSNIQVRVGGVSCAVVGVAASADFSVGPRAFILKVLPSKTLPAGLKELAVSIGDESSVEAEAIEYREPLPKPQALDSDATVLLLDTSSSMDEDDSSGMSKIDAARRAGERLTRMVANESSSTNVDELALITFSDGARVLQPLTSDVQPILAEIGQLAANGATNMEEGLDVAMRQSTQPDDTASRRRVLILLSDGLPNRPVLGGLLGAEDARPEIRSNHIPRLPQHFDCVYTIGLGQPEPAGSSEPSIDEDFLKDVSASTGGCGGYFRATKTSELVAAFLRARHQAKGGTMVVDVVGNSIRQDETTHPEVVSVDSGAGELNVTLDWPGSKLDLLLTDPQGHAVDAQYPGAQLFLDQPPAQAIVSSPMAGRWSVSVHGADVPEGTVEYSLLGSVRSEGAKPSPGSGAVVILIVLSAGLIVALMSGGRRSETSAFQFLLIAEGASMPTITLSPLPFYIGRSDGVQLSLDQDQRVSHRHAVVEAAGRSGLMIRDLDSSNGTFVNEARITGPTPLGIGSRVRVGRSSFQVAARD